MLQAISSLMMKYSQYGQRLLRLLDSACLYLSPLALLVFLVAGVFALDAFGEHRALLRRLAEHGIETVGTVMAFDWQEDDGLVVWLDAPDENEVQSLYIYTKYYPTSTLRALENGKRVRVRYTPPEHYGDAVLADAYDEVKAYGGFLDGLEWVLGGCLLILAMRPDILLVGLRSKDWELAGQSPAQTAPQPARLEEPTP